jgi:poly-gamma-glutamate synthesis protein (capsule biosynthesis protein)
MVSERTLVALRSILGEPAAGAVVVVPEVDLLDRAWAEQPTWAILPFEALEPRWKVLRIDGLLPLDRGLDLGVYPLVVRPAVTGPAEALQPFLEGVNLPATNRDESHMTVVVMTGVTALTRATAWRMEGKGLHYPAQDVGDWLRAADITHVSNEVSFDPECGPPNPVQEGLLFCSDPRYIGLLEHIGVDVVEMTGNHIADAGVEHIEPTLDMYVERGWQYFGGGRTLDDARQPAVFNHNGNAIAFLGCNPVGPPSVWATAERAGAAPCDYELLHAQLADLRSRGILPIVTLQYWEEDRYDPTPQQVVDFQALVEAGAVIASGSHAHHAQGFGFFAGGFIHFGVGNLFFDQMDLMGNRQEFIDRHIFYGGRHISTELLTALLEDWSRPRPMNEQERLQLLQTVFAVSRWE